MISHQHFPGPSGHPGCEASVRMSICDFSSIGLFQIILASLTEGIGAAMKVFIAKKTDKHLKDSLQIFLFPLLLVASSTAQGGDFLKELIDDGSLYVLL